MCWCKSLQNVRENFEDFCLKYFNDYPLAINIAWKEKNSIIRKRNYSGSNICMCSKMHISHFTCILQYRIHKQISPRYLLVNALKLEHYLEVLRYSSEMLHQKENQWKSCCSDMNILGFLPTNLTEETSKS